MKQSSLTTSSFAVALLATCCLLLLPNAAVSFTPPSTRNAFRVGATRSVQPLVVTRSLRQSTTVAEQETQSITNEAEKTQQDVGVRVESTQRQEKSEATSYSKEDDDGNQLAEFIGLGTWIAGLSSFLLINNYVGPWPSAINTVPVEYYGLAHAIGGMLFGGGIILTTLIEWLAVSSKNAEVLKFYFRKVPGLDAFVVLPALTASIISGVGLSVDHYNSLGESPIHVVSAISTLLAFALWWAGTDLTTQAAATAAIEEWTEAGDTENTEVPSIVQKRRISNVVSCLFIVALYAIMVLKPGYTP